MPDATGTIEQLGGAVTDIRDGVRHTLKLSSLSYNHPIYWLKRGSPDEVWFHVEVGGDALIDRLEEVLAVYPGGLLHIEAGTPVPDRHADGAVPLRRGGLRRLPGAAGARRARPQPAPVVRRSRHRRSGRAEGAHRPGGDPQPGQDRRAGGRRYGGQHRLGPADRAHHGPGRSPTAERRDPAAGRAVRPGGGRAAERGVDRRRSHRRDRASRAAPAAGDRPPDRGGDRRPPPSTEAAQAGLDVWRLPTLAYTKSDEHSWAPGTVWLDWDTMYRTCLEIGRAWRAMGAGTLVFANGHGGNTALLQVVLREIRKQYGLKTFSMPTLSVSARPRRRTGRGSTSTAWASTAAPPRPRSSCICGRTSSISRWRERWVPEHLADFELIGFNARPVSFGWLSDDFGTPGVVGDPDAGDRRVRRHALRRVRCPGGRLAAGDRAILPPAGRVMNPAAMFGSDVAPDAPVEDPLDLLDLWLARVDGAARGCRHDDHTADGARDDRRRRLSAGPARPAVLLRPRPSALPHRPAHCQGGRARRGSARRRNDRLARDPAPAVRQRHVDRESEEERRAPTPAARAICNCSPGSTTPSSPSAARPSARSAWDAFDSRAPDARAAADLGRLRARAGADHVLARRARRAVAAGLVPADR